MDRNSRQRQSYVSLLSRAGQRPDERGSSGGADEREQDRVDGENPATATKPNTTANAAPALIPNICGEASGFFVASWVNNPAKASWIPTMQAIKARGSRKVCTYKCSLSFP